jgi:hypothetical protein
MQSVWYYLSAMLALMLVVGFAVRVTTRVKNRTRVGELMTLSLLAQDVEINDNGLAEVRQSSERPSAGIDVLGQRSTAASSTVGTVVPPRNPSPSLPPGPPSSGCLSSRDNSGCSVHAQYQHLMDEELLHSVGVSPDSRESTASSLHVVQLLKSSGLLPLPVVDEPMQPHPAAEASNPDARMSHSHSMDVEQPVPHPTGPSAAGPVASDGDGQGDGHGDACEEATARVSTDVRPNKCARHAVSCMPSPPPPSCSHSGGDHEPPSALPPSAAHTNAHDLTSDRGGEARPPAAAAAAAAAAAGGVGLEAASPPSYAPVSAVAHAAAAAHPAASAHAPVDDLPPSGGDPTWSDDSEARSEAGSATSFGEAMDVSERAPAEAVPQPVQRARVHRPRVSFGLMKREARMWDAIAMPPPRERPSRRNVDQGRAPGRDPACPS